MGKSWILPTGSITAVLGAMLMGIILADPAKAVTAPPATESAAFVLGHAPSR